MKQIRSSLDLLLLWLRVNYFRGESFLSIMVRDTLLCISDLHMQRTWRWWRNHQVSKIDRIRIIVQSKGGRIPHKVKLFSDVFEQWLMLGSMVSYPLGTFSHKDGIFRIPKNALFGCGIDSDANTQTPTGPRWSPPSTSPAIRNGNDIWLRTRQKVRKSNSLKRWQISIIPSLADFAYSDAWSAKASFFGFLLNPYFLLCLAWVPLQGFSAWKVLTINSTLSIASSGRGNSGKKSYFCRVSLVEAFACSSSSEYKHFSWAISFKLLRIIVWYRLCWNICLGKTIPTLSLGLEPELSDWTFFFCPWPDFDVVSSRGVGVGSCEWIMLNFRLSLECLDTSIPPVRCLEISSKNEGLKTLMSWSLSVSSFLKKTLNESKC